MSVADAPAVGETVANSVGGQGEVEEGAEPVSTDDGDAAAAAAIGSACRCAEESLAAEEVEFLASEGLSASQVQVRISWPG